MTMTYQQPQAQNIPTPPTGPTPSPAPGGAGPVVAADVEAQFIGKFLGGFLENAVPLLLDALRSRVSASGTTDPVSVQQEYEETGAAFLNILLPILTTVAPIAIDLIKKAVGGQAAGGAGAQTTGAQVYAR